MEAIRSISRATEIIDMVALTGPNGARLIDVVSKTGLQKTTAHRILATLVGIGWLEQDSEFGTFHLGVKLAGLGNEALDRHGVSEIANPRLTSLARSSEDTVFLSVRSGVDALCVDRMLGSFPIRTLTLQVGDRRPLGIGAGSLALLAWQPDDEVELALANPPSTGQYTIPDRASMRQSIRFARDNGYTVNDGGIVPGAVGIGVPVLDDDRNAIASLSLAAISSRMGPDRMRSLTEMMTREAEILAEDLHQIAPRLSAPSIRRLLPAHS